MLSRYCHVRDECQWRRGFLAWHALKLVPFGVTATAKRAGRAQH